MLSFDLSAIDIVLLIAVLTLFILYANGRSGASKTESKHETKINKQKQIPQQETEENYKIQPSYQLTSKQTDTEPQNCIHQFGHLKNLPRNTPVPEECFGCPKVMQCLFPNEQQTQTTHTE